MLRQAAPVIEPLAMSSLIISHFDLTMTHLAVLACAADEPVYVVDVFALNATAGPAHRITLHVHGVNVGHASPRLLDNGN
jgi:hypothetical protein